MKSLSLKLQPILELELELGNEIDRVDEPAGTKCPLAVVFKRPFHFAEIRSQIIIQEGVTEWENNDPHYPAERGFHCKVTNHVISAPKQ